MFGVFVRVCCAHSFFIASTTIVGRVLIRVWRLDYQLLTMPGMHARGITPVANLDDPPTPSWQVATVWNLFWAIGGFQAWPTNAQLKLRREIVDSLGLLGA